MAAAPAPVVLVIGTGTIGNEVAGQLRAKGCKVLTGRRSPGMGDVQIDIMEVESIKSLATQIPDGVDHVVATAGHSAFGPIEKFNSKTWEENIAGKLVCLTRLAVMLANEEVKLVRDGGSITITSGLKARIMDRKWPGVSANCAGIDAFVRCAGHDCPRNLRLNAVALTLVTETAIDAGMSTENTVSAHDVAAKFVESALGHATAEVFVCGDASKKNQFGSEVFDMLHNKNKRKATEPAAGEAASAVPKIS